MRVRIHSEFCGFLMLVLAICGLHFSAARAESYDVGPGFAYENIGDVAWETLDPGDSVRIHYRETHYHEKWVICRQGTSEAPIVVQGIPSPGGDLPVINGMDATTRSELNFWNEERGVLKIGGANQPPDTTPAYIIIENLEIRSGRPPFSFSGRYGLTSYVNNCAAIYIEKGEHVQIRNCTLWDCGNGLFCGHLMTDLVVEGNTVYGNGIEGSIYEHNNYTEAFGVLFQFNHFGPLRTNCLGNNLKDRSAGCVIRYNWIESGNRQLDLVDSDYASFYDDPSYRQTYVYGNILIEPDGAGNSQILHYGGDSGATERYRKGTLYLHNNTIVSTRSGNTTLARLSTNDERCDARNNIIYVEAAGYYLAMLAESGGLLELRGNWIKPGWVLCHGSTPGEVVDYGNVEGQDPGFIDFAEQSFELRDGSDAIDAGVDLAAGIETDHRPVMEYVKHALSRPRHDDSILDIGAYEFASDSSVDGTGGLMGLDPIKAYPNPFSNRLTIEGSATSPLVMVGVDGRIVWESGGYHAGAGEGNAESMNWDWNPPADLRAGIYYLGIRGSSPRAGRKVIYIPDR
ncbi:MAG: polysaccharide-degrading enzyme [Candidatus Eisenbacteria bacterium]|nr:polysaccharide-degrading enzyme [Candidatus Eisenbacteria bacterium]